MASKRTSKRTSNIVPESLGDMAQRAVSGDAAPGSGKTKGDAARGDGSGESPVAASRAALRKNEIEARRRAVRIARLAADDKCDDIVVLDLRGISPICDYFVIATGTSDRQMAAVSDHVEEMLRHDGDKPFSVQGRREGQWVVLDYVDVIVHLFDHAFRKHYDLEILWGDAPHVDWETESKQPESAA